MDAKDILTDAFGRLPGNVHSAVHGFTPEQLRWAPAPGANSIGWLIWHLTRVQDDHVAEVMGEDQIYLTGDWPARFGLKDDAETGYGHSAAQVATVAPESPQSLEDYFRAVHDRTMTYLAGLTDEDLDRVVDAAWDPPVTLGVRLVSVADDDAQHVGQAAYLRGLL
ncbi:mycothiol transferase [Actinoplanes subtropicus]|uniref:mycothiol transferase n=1 Tax=Actinoplanes subtropicus TaxID=543632 RepID=UPI0004C2C8FC|nr:DinB family protein [Actinoplanes subtropicus]